uniref:Uncharacterized protein n=1 Tax=Arundo donax TaxID=35708 RepID=A0A0A9GVM8_ARUDO
MKMILRIVRSFLLIHGLLPFYCFLTMFMGISQAYLFLVCTISRLH